ncbi:MAG TPA: phosphoenolpyruvate--protein phosphotransferase [Candidatus Copromorpha excrementipullorum]|uniref:Phosphoenolpyruvate-protein phosphotransferase n=1 Tax=Candidatus Allocopromorpha excrementipullorum TaxID=2840743 RepID=A0A9D1N5Y1_9FIRM|nr:phosphoenolpyruvate--protein phosphotransferase [Candidatus Copromorpha excrementipullorum]
MLKGIAVSEGMACGTAVVIKSESGGREKTYRQAESSEKERSRFREAYDSFIKDAEKAAEGLKSRGLEQEAGILLSHVEMVKDPSVASGIEENISNGCCAEEAVDKTLGFFADMFEATGDELTMQRASDVRDINNELIKKLTGNEGPDISSLPEGSVLVTDELTPSMTVDMKTGSVVGIVAETGGYTSHSAILARALGVPAVLSVGGATKLIAEGQDVAVDGISGDVIVSPDNDEKKRCEEKAEAFRRQKALTEEFRGKMTVTASGEKKEVVANIGNAGDVSAAKDGDAEGVGLFRTEFLYMDRDSAPDEEEQLASYREVAEAFAPAPVIIRTLDVGGDKDVQYLDMGKEDNPFMGFRAIRYCLENQQLFRTQLRALLRANTAGNIRIMLPMVTELQEIRDVRKLIDESVEELKAEGKEFGQNISLGIMVETPAAAATADILAEEADFFSIGTNDLTGYMMSADRGNGKVAYLYSVYQPAVLRMIRNVCEAAHKAGIPVGMCGEAAADPALIPCLLGFGLDEFSVGSRQVLATRRTISLWSRQEAEDTVRKVMTLHTVEETEAYLNSIKK